MKITRHSSISDHFKLDKLSVDTESDRVGINSIVRYKFTKLRTESFRKLIHLWTETNSI